MSPILESLLKMAIPLVEKMGLDEWSKDGLPFLQKQVDKLESLKGKEEAQIFLDALDKIVHFEAARQVP